MMAPSHRCQNIKCPCTGTGVRVRSAFERGGACSREEYSLERGGARPRGACALGPGGTCSRGEYSLQQGGARPRGACALERGGTCSRGSLSEPPWWAVGTTAAWAMPRVFKQDVVSLGFLQVLSGVAPVV
jgi:hypothetical protein